MPFTAQEVEHIGQAVLDYHMNTPNVRSQTLQDKPLLQAMMGKQKKFPGGKENITVRVKGEYTTTIQGFEHDDPVAYGNPANLKTATYPWKLIHSGIQVTYHELLKAGIKVSDTSNGSGAGGKFTDAEKIQLVDLMKDKVEDMVEGTDRGMNEMFWKDGTQDSKVVPGVRSFILNNPASATVVAGIDQSANTWWRNRFSLSLNAGTPADQVVVTKLQQEWRQLRRYGGRPDLVLCGSDFIDAMEKELRAKGNYTLEGWTSQKSTDASIADISFKGTKFTYDPTLDDMSLAKYCFVLDTRHIYPMVIEERDHTPARPENKYVFYKAKTWVGGLVCDQRNAQGIYSIS